MLHLSSYEKTNASDDGYYKINVRLLFFVFLILLTLLMCVCFPNQGRISFLLRRIRMHGKEEKNEKTEKVKIILSLRYNSI